MPRPVWWSLQLQLQAESMAETIHAVNPGWRESSAVSMASRRRSASPGVVVTPRLSPVLRGALWTRRVSTPLPVVRGTMTGRIVASTASRQRSAASRIAATSQHKLLASPGASISLTKRCSQRATEQGHAVFPTGRESTAVSMATKRCTASSGAAATATMAMMFLAM